MKRHTFWIAVIISLLLVPALMLVCKKTIVPNTAAVDGDTLTYYEPISAIELPFGIDTLATEINNSVNFTFNWLIMDTNQALFMIDTNNVLTIYKPGISVVWDTLEVKK